MRIADLDFILIPEWLAGTGRAAPDPDHWMSRWQRNIATAQWLDTTDQDPPAGLLAQCAQSTRPVVIVTHGQAVEVLLSASAEIADRPVIGAFIVAPAPRPAAIDAAPGSLTALTFPSILVAPDDHPDFGPTAAQNLSQRLGSDFVAAGPAGRIDSASGQGPWPEGLMRLGRFLKRLSAH